MWKLKGRGNWVVEDQNNYTRFLFRTKKEATAYAKANNLNQPYKRD